MSRPVTQTKILDDGLRYQSKVSGSLFSSDGTFGTAKMSCFLCGRHRVRSTMLTRKFMGKPQAVCAPSCKTAKEMDAAVGSECDGAGPAVQGIKRAVAV
jgi:hypothetical protein